MPWKKGQSGNPKGRPKKGNALADAIRDLVDPREQVKRVLHIATKSTHMPTRLQAEMWLADRCYPKPATEHNVNVSQEPSERVAELEERIEAQRARLADIKERLLLGCGVEDADIVDDDTDMAHDDGDE